MIWSQGRPRRSARIGGIERINEVELRLLHDHRADESAQCQGIPLNVKLDAIGRKQRHRDVAGDLHDAHIANRVGTAPQVQLNGADPALVKRAPVQRAVHVLGAPPTEASPAQCPSNTPSTNTTMKNFRQRERFFFSFFTG